MARLAAVLALVCLLGAYSTVLAAPKVTKAALAPALAPTAVPVVTAKICPFTSKPAVKPAGKLPRCSGVGELTCCTVCDDAQSALNILSRNGSAVLGFLNLNNNPVLGSLVATLSGALAQQQFCSLFAKNPDCLNMIESLYCSLTCNPDAASFVKLSGKTAATVAVCDTFADSIYSSCSSMLIPGLNQPLKGFIDNSNDFVRLVVGPLARSVTSLKTLNTTVVPAAANAGKCFNGPPGGTYPKVTVCCDELSGVPSTCLGSTSPSSVKAETSNTTPSLASYVNRTLPSTCPAPGTPPSSGSGSPSGTKGARRGFSVLSMLTTLFMGAVMLVAVGSSMGF